ncbi:MAG: hypothetical protein IKC89_07215 [Lentisphaeria bacterium]|nr:hypothetical protein [Lentisphaeria bacterium]
MKKVHFVGIGGAGMAPLAQLLLARKVAVSGSDIEFNSKCQQLSQLGAEIFTGHKETNLAGDVDIVVYTSAAAADNPELLEARRRLLPCFRRGEFLAEYAKNYRRVIAVSGTHGKSSISALIAAILCKCGKNPGFMIGAQIAGMPSCDNGIGDDIFVTEADESDGTHTALTNFIGVVPNVEDDHAWSLGGVEVLDENFRTFARKSEILLYYASPKCDRLFAGHPHAVRLEQMPESFAGSYGFQAANSFLACRAAELAGCDEAAAVAAAGEYPQVKRRMTLHASSPACTIIEDYAHHPTEVARSLELLRLKYPGAKLTVIFQPHRYARLERYFDEFAEVLKAADSTIIVPVFAAWCESGSVGSCELAAACGGTALDGSWEDIASGVAAGISGTGNVIAILGAGDIEQLIAPLTARLCGSAQ